MEHKVKYILFSGNTFYPLGGYKDFVGCYKTIDEAKEAWTNLVIEDCMYDGWGQIVKNHKIILEIKKDLTTPEIEEWEPYDEV